MFLIYDVNIVYFKMEEVDLMAASLENSIGSTGGFCGGRKYVIDHQVKLKLSVSIEINLIKSGGAVVVVIVWYW